VIKLANEEITRHQARIAALAAQVTALKAAGKISQSDLGDLSVAAGDSLMAITYQAGGEGRKGKG